MHSLCCISPVPFERDSQGLSKTQKTNKMSSESSTPHRSVKEGSNSNVISNHISANPSAHASSARAMPAAPVLPVATKHCQPTTDLTVLVDHEHQNRSPSELPGGAGKVFTVTPEGGMKTATNFSGELFQVVDTKGCTPQAGTTSVAGILHKWVNYGKGWRPRWFTLTEGVLSYYKVHGPDKVTVNSGRFKGFRLIGDEAQRLMRKQKHAHSEDKTPSKASGEVHLKVQPSLLCSARSGHQPAKANLQFSLLCFFFV